MVLISQVSGHLLTEAITAYDATAAQTAAVVNETTDLALSASALGLAFSAAVIFTVRDRLDPELRTYRATGLPATAALRLILTSHPVLPVAAALSAGGLAALADAALGLDPLFPLSLAAAFSGTLSLWLVAHVLRALSREAPDRGSAGRVG
ncbi:MAG: hypothetical protein ABSF83_14650 [Nitrososphaerales archaeon]|jgi:hypothetical protein